MVFYPLLAKSWGDSLEKNEINITIIFKQWCGTYTTEYCIGINMGSAFIYLRWISVDFYILFSYSWIYLSKTSLLIQVYVCVHILLKYKDLRS